MSKGIVSRVAVVVIAACMAGACASRRPSPTPTLVRVPAPAATVPPTAVEHPSPTPTELGVVSALELWASYYRVHLAVAAESGVLLLGMDGQALGPTLSEQDWCDAALEGTVSVEYAGTQTVYNFADCAGPVQADCGQFYPGLTTEILEAMSQTRFLVCEAPYGYGVNGLYLVPYRTVAVDSELIPYGTLLYIPAARGVEVALPSGERVSHDGYFYAGDTGGAITGNHSDVFAGVYQDNPFPEFVHSTPERTFKAFVVQNSDIREEMERRHNK